MTVVITDKTPGPTAVVYVSDGNDVWRIRKSIASLRRIGIVSDIFVLTVGHPTVDDRYLQLQCKAVVEVDGILSSLGFSPAGWNRPWPYACLGRLTIPLVPELRGYDRVLNMDTDVLALTPRFVQWLTWPTRGFEVVGAVGDLHTETAGRSDDVEVDRCFCAEGRALEMQRRLWCRNPPYTHTHINIGVSLWDLALIRSDEEWYKTRLRWFWEAECHGFMFYLDEGFVNVFMDIAALVDSSMHEGTHTIHTSAIQPAAHHFNQRAGSDDPGNDFNVKARELGLDDDIARVVASGRAEA